MPACHPKNWETKLLRNESRDEVSDDDEYIQSLDDDSQPVTVATTTAGVHDLVPASSHQHTSANDRNDAVDENNNASNNDDDGDGARRPLY
eukprot:9389030-Pyramimonas_sp.AAC.1